MLQWAQSARSAHGNSGFNHNLLIPRGLKGTNSVPGHHVFNHLPPLLTPILFQFVPKSQLAVVGFASLVVIDDTELHLYHPRCGR
jgi:hypothetical protein